MTPEDLVDVPEAARQLVMKHGALRMFLLRHPEIPARYRNGWHNTPVRVLTTAEVAWIRAHRDGEDAH